MSKFNLILLVLFGTGALAIAQLAYGFLVGNARRHVLADAELMMASAKSVRDYTSSDLTPLLNQLPEHKVRFRPETVPAFGATATFNRLRVRYPQYVYKEATLNPTNPEDRATDWEVDVIRWLRSHPEQQQSIGEREGALGKDLYFATPIKAAPSCLVCHSVPAAAPKGMLAVYGSTNGFGWKADEVVGAQIVSVPLALPVEIANRDFHQLLVYLGAMLLATILALDAAVYWFVVRPLRAVSETADRISRGEKDVPPLTVDGNDEIATVMASFNRMQLSLAKAIVLLNG